MSPTLASSRKLNRRINQVLTYALLLVGLVWFSFPLVWMILGSFKPFQDFAQLRVRLFPSSWHPENYIDAWKVVPFGMFFRNSFVLAAINIFGTLLSCSLAAYGFSRLRFWGRDVAFAVLLATMMLPGWVTLIPTFIIFRQLGWINTWYPLTVPAFLGGSSAIFLMRQFFLTLPTELDEAALIDGCGRFGIYWRILLPLCKPVMATIAIFTFLSIWNDFMGPLIYLRHHELFTVAIGLAFMRSAVVETSTAARQPVQALIMAAGVFTSAPGIIIFFVGQRSFVQGIALTGRTGM
ncbi:MAG: carbohydrate ABC transporter permease [Chloroflexi bacterium]|nr:carbohydrate ABC transporter permease [Chloroflexota bacterium]